MIFATVARSGVHSYVVLMQPVDVNHIQSVEQRVVERAGREIRAQRSSAAGDETNTTIAIPRRQRTDAM
jgi:hypothetical protein